jgi:hypothetical protein
MATYNNTLNITPEGIDIEKFNEAVSAFRRTRLAIVDLDKNETEIRDKLATAQQNLQKAIETFNYVDIQKFTAECKRESAKLEMGPEAKHAAFNEAADNLAKVVLANLQVDPTIVAESFLEDVA